MQNSFPPGLKVDVAFDTTDFVTVVIDDVKSNTFEAIIYAIITIMIFIAELAFGDYSCHCHACSDDRFTSRRFKFQIGIKPVNSIRYYFGDRHCYR